MGREMLRWLYWLSLTLAAALVVYKIYLNFFEQDFAAEHAAQVEDIEAALNGRTNFRFAVVGNISNSVGIFERKIIPLLNRGDYDFVVSAGNALSTGGEDKYRAIYRTLTRLNMPYLLTFGPQEESRLGGFRFYDHFGPLHFSFGAGNNRLVFLDSTGTTDFGWQYRWLEEELAAADETNLFVFSAHPLYPVKRSGLFGLSDDNLFAGDERERFAKLIEHFEVDTVFSANFPVFDLETHDETRYVVTGGAGGLVINNERSHYHYVSVSVEGDQVAVEERRLQIGQHPIWRNLESFWFFVHSLFYVGYLNFILLVSIFVAVAIWLKTRIFTERDYYPDFDTDPDTMLDMPLRIAMFTNNYLPFIGGVPISIDRLRQGLVQLGHTVLIVAPRYPNTDADDPFILRVRALLPLGRHREFRLANVFSPRLYRQVFRFRPDIIHVHHPFWLGSAGVFLARRLGIPVVYTYHTRLEHYAHYVPLPGPLFRNLVSHAVVRRFANRCDAVIVPTESAEEYLRTIGVRRRILVQPTGIDVEKFRAVPEERLRQLQAEHAPRGERILISISRLSGEKNIDFLLNAIRTLKIGCAEPFRLLIIGDGPERQRIDARIRELGLADSVSLLGAVAPEQIPVYCRLGDIFLFASRSETQGMVILEAMAAGMPVVAVRSSGIDDIVDNGFNGFKTPADTAQWSARIEQLLLDPALHKKLSANAESFADNFSISRFSESVQRFYAGILVDQKTAILPGTVNTDDDKGEHGDGK
ncbi:glycosyltransferase [Haliea sp. E1-2-M8]|uniref:glycosyltransferase n=1 Tax=Haliea sp. E1-2-M8 TaxID=3064706 RepID=UPI002717122D|nr:glycosyltransferase [Haliea sp. E1-2-M8]MDO8863462.1 glycosyltransferase [Haliea sp. E1-2-M8]